MPVPSISLEEFQQSNQAVLSDGGPWLGAIDPGQRSGETVCVSQKWVWCDGFCLVSAVFPPETQSSYQTSFTANISVPMDRYGGATQLDFTWNYWPLYCGSELAAGRNFPMHLQVGSASFDDSLVTVDYKVFFAGAYPWEPSPKFSHSGTTTVTRGSDGTHGYIPITISMAMNPVGTREWLNLYIKGIGFQITTPTQDSASVSSTTTNSRSTTSTLSSSSSVSTGASNGSQSAGSSATSTLPLSGGPDSGLSTDPSVTTTPSSKVSTGTVVGSVMGAVAFLSIILLGFLIYRRRRRRSLKSSPIGALDVSPLPFTTPADSVDDMSKKRPNVASWGQVASTTFSEATNSQIYSSVVAPTQIDGLPVQEVPRPPLLTASQYLLHNRRIPQGDAGPSFSSAQDRSVSRGAPAPTHPSSNGSEAPSGTYDPPPNYGGAAALSAWSNMNRTVISEDLEARLLSAGYLPNDDPDSLTEEEWRQYGVTKLELLRLRRLFVRDYVDIQKQ